MSVTGAIGGFFRGTLIAAATAAAAFGLLAVFQPFARPPEPVTVASDNVPAQAALQGRIEALRLALRDTETAIGATTAATDVTSTSDVTRMQYEAQIAAATERRDLARRHAAAIRAELEAGGSVSSLTGIRDSVVVGQLLSQLSALDAQIAIEGTRLLAAHPTMRALTAQRASLQTQIRQEATNIAAALEAEAKLDDAQIALLQQQVPTMATEAAAPADTSALEARAAAQRAELDRLVDAYFDTPAAAGDRPAVANDPFSLPNLIVIGVAGFVAIAAQLLLAMRRRRAERDAEDMAAWQADDDSELETDLVSEPEPLRRAS